jgi:phage-related protein
MVWNIIYYSNKISREIQKLPKGFYAKYLYLAEKMILDGPNLGMPYTKALGNGLFELRIKAQEGIMRAFYCTIVNNNIVILHSFIKKSQKIPKKEMDIARNRLKEVQNG